MIGLLTVASFDNKKVALKVLRRRKKSYVGDKKANMGDKKSYVGDKKASVEDSALQCCVHVVTP